MPEEIKRQTAHKVRIRELIENPYQKEEGEWEPNYISIGNKKVSRVNLMGVIVSKNDNEPKSILLDDGSGKIQIRSFGGDNIVKDLAIGDIVLVIGRPREFNNEKYILPEITKKVKDRVWVDLRKAELDGKERNEDRVNNKKDIIKTEHAVVDEKRVGSYNNILKRIKDLDSGEGANSDEIVSEFGLEVENIINNLLENGEIFEIKPGRLKVLE